MASKNIGLVLQQILNKLTLTCQREDFILHFKKIGLNFILEGTEDAYNEKKNDSEKVKVSKLCSDVDDVWIFSKIIFEQIESIKYSTEEFEFYQKNSFRIGKAFFKISISISVFQGIQPNKKIQLFRAEWDNHKNEIHPQPHWQFYPVFIGEDSIKINIEDLSFKKEEETFSPLNKKIENTTTNLYNFKNFHFAMTSGNWYTDIAHINFIKNENDLISWYIGLLKHIKNQLIHCLK